MKAIEIKSCSECLFKTNNLYLENKCKLTFLNPSLVGTMLDVSHDVKNKTIHLECPLRRDDVTFKLPN